MGGRGYNYSPLLRLPLHWNEGGMTDGHLHNQLTNMLDDIVGNMGRSWKNPVPNVGDLPPTLNTLGDARVVTTSSEIYIWNGTAWVGSTGGALTYMGVWDATNPPAGGNPVLSDATGGKGHYYVVSASGVQNLGSGPIDFNPGDWVVHNGTIWQKADHTDTVTSVFGRQGAVVAVAGDYAASQVTNDSGVAGVYVSNALDNLSAAAPNLHAVTHKPGGTDEVGTALPAVDAIPKSGSLVPTIHPDWIQDATELVKGKVELAADKESAPNVVVQGNDSRLSDARTPTAHATSHENGGSDEISVLNLSGLLADAQTPLGHRATHISGGSDAFLATDVLEAVVKRIQESSGPTTLTVGAIADGQRLQRTGSTLVGVTPHPYGEDADRSLQEAAASVTGTVAWSTLHTWTTGTLPVGTYKVMWSYNWSSSSTVRDMTRRVQVNGTTVTGPTLQNIEVVFPNLKETSGFMFITLATPGTLTVNVDLQPLNAADTGYIQFSRLEIIRVA